MNLNLDKAKILVVGDSGVGKSSLVHLICHQEVLKKPSWTIGCSVDVKLHEFKDGTVNHKPYFIEFWDVGGSTSCRNIFYSGVDGIILTHDLTNRKSQDNLKQWLYEISDDKLSSITVSSGSANDHYNQNTFESTTPPAIVIGTKLDEAQLVRDLSSLRTSSQIALEYRFDEINLVGAFSGTFLIDSTIFSFLKDCLQTKYLSPGSTNSVKLAKFFDKVIEYKLKQSSRDMLSKKATKSVYGNYHAE